MSNSDYLWKVTSMMVLPKQDGQTDVVVLASYSVTSEIIGAASVQSSQQFTYTGGEFTPYDQLTEEQVIGWIQSALGEDGVANIYANIDGQVNAIQNPPPSPEPQPLPWS
jgi:hypothetical protein